MVSTRAIVFVVLTVRGSFILDLLVHGNSFIIAQHTNTKLVIESAQQ